MINKPFCILFLFLFISLIKCSKIDIDNIGNSGNNSDNSSTITVFLIPHSHCDLGWVKTVDQYYTTEVELILNGVINRLIKDSTKKFNWAETYYFQRWWYQQNSTLQSQVKQLINNKQLYFVGGGWAQNDEALTHYQAVINQMTLGHQFLLSEFNFVPEIGWQIDPFGPSTLTATLFSLMGFKYHVINRIDDRIKYPYYGIKDSGWMSTDKSFEFIWNPSSNNDKISIFTHVLDHHYDSPSLTFLNASTTGFDFEGDPTINPPINSVNLRERADILVEIIKQRSVLYRHNNLLLPFGSDFRFQNESLEFDNMDQLIEYINSNSNQYGVYIQYATLNEYFEKVEKDTNGTTSSDVDGSSSSSGSSESITFPIRGSNDLLAYAVCIESDFLMYQTCVNWWSGYFSSFPLLKQTVRSSDSLLRVGEMLYSLSSSYSNGYDFDFDISYEALEYHRNVSGILTHHDAVTGTAAGYVRDDYFNMLDEAESLTLNYNVPDLIGYLLSNKSLNRDYTSGNTSLLDAQEGDIIPISFSNSLAWDRFEQVSIEIPSNLISSIAVYDYQLVPVVSQILQRFDKDGKWYLHMSVATPALGISTYFFVILTSSGELTIDNQYLPIPIPSIISSVASNTTTSISIGNSLFNLNFETNINNPQLLELVSFEDLTRNQLSIPISLQFLEYTSLSDNAYKLVVSETVLPLELHNPQFYHTSGPIVQMVTILYNSNCSVSFIVYNDTTATSPFGDNDNDNNNSTLIRDDQYFEIDNTVASGWDKEISVSIKTSIENGNEFYTSNGLEMMKRNRKIHFGDKTGYSKMSGNFYPIVNTGFIRDNTTQLTILTNQAIGASSQSSGEFNLLLIRRNNYTHVATLGPMNDTSNPTIKIRCIITSPYYNDLIRTPHSILFENQLQPVFSSIIDSTIIPLDKYISIYNTLFKPLINSFPYNLHLVTFTKQWSNSQSIIMRLLNIYELNQNQYFSKSINFSINNYFDSNYYNISQITQTSLSVNTILSNHSNTDNLIITLEPLELKTFILTLNPSIK